MMDHLGCSMIGHFLEPSFRAVPLKMWGGRINRPKGGGLDNLRNEYGGLENQRKGYGGLKNPKSWPGGLKIQ